MQAEQDLRKSLASQYDAYRDLAEDFTQYQAVTDLQIEQLTAETAELRNSLAFERAQADSLSQRLERTQRELQGRNTEIAELKAILSRPTGEQTQSHGSDPNVLSGISGAFEQTVSDLCFSQAANSTRLHEIRALETQLRQERDAQNDLQKQVKSLKQQLNERNINKSITDLQGEISLLKQTLYKSLTLIAALGCPLDVFSQDVIKEIQNYTEYSGDNGLVDLHGTPGTPISLEQVKKVETLINAGLRLLGARPTSNEPDVRHIKVRSTRVVRGQDMKNPNAVTVEEHEDVLERNLYTFRSLQLRCEQLESSNAVLRTENYQGLEEVSQLKQRLQIQQKANEKLMELLKKEMTAHRHLHEAEVRWNERLHTITNSVQKTIAELRNATLQEVSQIVSMQNDRDRVVQFVEKLLPFMENQILNKFNSETLENIIRFDFSEALEVLKQINVQPVLYDVKSLLTENLNAPIPTNYIKQLETFFYSEIETILNARELNDKLHRILILLLLNHINSQNDEESCLKKSGIFKVGLEKVKEFSQAFIQLARSFNLSQDDILNFYGAKQEEQNAIIDGNAYNQITEQYILALQQQVADLKGELATVQTNNNTENTTGTEGSAESFPGEVKTRADDGAAGPGNLLRRYGTSDEVRGLISKAITQNQSGRYISFLEILIHLILEWVSKGGKELFKIAGELSKVTESQVSQAELLRRQVGRVVSVAEMAEARVGALTEDCNALKAAAEAATLVQKKLIQVSPEALSMAEQYTDKASQMVRLMESCLTRFQEHCAQADAIIGFGSPGTNLTGQTGASPSTSLASTSLREKYQVDKNDGERGENWKFMFKVISSQFLELQTKMAQFQEFIYQDREKVVQYVEFQKRQERDRINKLRQSFVNSEQRREKQEKEAAIVRQRYAQLSLKYEEAKNQFQKQIQNLQTQLQKTREDKDKTVRSNREELIRNFRAKEEVLEEQIKMLREIK